MQDPYTVARIQLCESCRALELGTHLTDRGRYVNTSYQHLCKAIIKLRPDNCSLCALVELLDQKHRVSRWGTAGKSEREFQLEVVRFPFKKIENEYSGEDEDWIWEYILRFRLLTSHGRIIGELQPCPVPIPSVHDYCNTFHDESKIPKVPSGRFTEPFVDVRLLKYWMDSCAKYHSRVCSEPSWTAATDSLPPRFRLIDVRNNCIIESPADPLYLSLSYVWGASEHDIRATLSNIADLKLPSSLIHKHIPRTILDSMALVNRLGYQYMWVDRLCILQDDDNDKSKQIPFMDCIYSRAVATIVAASGSDAHDGIAGLSIERRIDQRMCLVSPTTALIASPCALGHTENEFLSCTWNRRGWTMQEKLLSRRIIYFTKEEVSWSCQAADWAERTSFEHHYLDSPNEYKRIPKVSVMGLFKYDLMSTLVEEKFGSLYYKRYIIREYAQRRFSNESDTLDGITGILKRVARVTGYSFYWGHIIQYDFGRSLSWQRKEPVVRNAAFCTVRDDKGSYSVPLPSWSWLSSRSLSVFPVLQAKIEQELDFFALDTSGRVKTLAMSASRPRLSSVDQSYVLPGGRSGSWKGEHHVKPYNFKACGPFRDSGRLLFWTSHAELYVVRSTEEPREFYVYNIVDATGTDIGYIREMFFRDETHSGKIPLQHDEHALESIIVLSRGDWDKQPTLEVMWVEWKDAAKTTASRISVGNVEEEAWLGVKRDWRAVILQ
jgi:hypothetical protein